MRTINKDIELVIGADISKSTTQLRNDLNIIINKLKDVTKITFTSNLSEIRKEAEEVARLLSSLKGSAAGGIVSTGAGGGITAMTSEKAAFEYAAKMREAQINREMDLMAKEEALRQKNNAATEARNVRAEIAAHEAAERALARENKEIERNAQLSRQASVEGQASADRISSALDKYARAQNSSNAKSREAYAGLQGLQTRLDALNKDYSSGKIGPEEYRRELSLLNKEAENLGGTLKRNDEGAMTFGERLKKAFTNIGTTISTTRIIMAAYRAVRQMIQASIELDTSMNQLRIVTGASADEMQRFADTTAETAKRIGASITDLASSATVFARLGYSLSESSQLAEYTTMLQNVGNISAEDAQDAVTAIIKAYSDVDVSNIESVMDRLVKVGNSFPISTSQIAEGMNNASSALAAAGNNFDQSVALLTAANTTVQNAAKASTGLRTIAARLRNTKTDLDELGEDMTTAKYEAVVKALTDANVALRDTTGEYRSTYDIMKDIADQWDRLSNTRQAALATEIAGTRQQAIFYSIINQFREASGAMDAMANSAGTLDQAYSIYLDSAQGRINQFKATFQDLAQDVIKSDWIEDVVEWARWLVESLNSVLSVLVKIIDALGGIKTVLPAIIAMYASAKFVQSLDNIEKRLQSIAKILSTITGAESATIASGMTKALSGLKGVLSKIGPYIGKFLAVFAFLKWFWDKHGLVGTNQPSWEIAEGALDELNEARSEISGVESDISSLESQVESLRAELVELNKIENPTLLEQNEIKKVEDAIEKTDLLIKGKEKLLELDKAEERAKFVAAAKSEFEKKDTGTGQLPLYSGNPSLDIIELGDQGRSTLYKTLSEMISGLERIENPLSEADKEFNDFFDRVSNYMLALEYRAAIEAAENVEEKDQIIVDIFNRVLKRYGVTADEFINGVVFAETDTIKAVREALEGIGFTLGGESGSYVWNFKAGDALGKDKALKEFFEYFANAARSAAEQTDDLNDSVITLKGSLETLDKATGGLNTLDKIFTDVANGNGFDFSSLVDSGFIETFGGLTEEFDEFIYAITNSPDNIDACRSAFNNLTKAYLNQLGVTDKLNEETQATIVAYLNSMGVQAHLIESLQRVADAKRQVLSAKIITVDSVQQLMNEAAAAGADAQSMERLLRVKELLSQPEPTRPHQHEAWLAWIRNQVDEILAEPFTYDNLNVDDFIGDYTGGSSYQSYLDSEAKAAEKAATDAEKAAENAKTWFDIQLAEHKHRVQMEQETEAQYLAWLDKAYKQAYAEGIHDLDEYRKYEEEVYDGRQKLAENAQSALDKLVDYRKKMLEQEVDDQKDALKEQLDALKDFYDKQKEMLQDSFDEEDYLRDQEEKRKSVTDIELKLAQIRGDDSAAAAKRRAELNQQLKEAKEELTDFERDHARDAATKLLDDEYAKQEEAINAQIDSLDEKYKSAKELYEEALRDIKSGSVSLYQEMIAWNAEYGDGIDDTITSAWENAYKALQDYKTLYGSMFGGANLANATGYRYPSGGGYASGTSWAIPGLRGIDEAGSETIFESSNGRKYKMFSGGEKVLNARASDFLYRFANGGSQLLEKFVKRVTGGVPEGIGARMQTNAIEMGDIIIQGNADRETISQIRREQRKAVDFMLKEINSLNY